MPHAKGHIRSVALFLLAYPACTRCCDITTPPAVEGNPVVSEPPLRLYNRMMTGYHY